jgi:hypothetical protein
VADIRRRGLSKFRILGFIKDSFPDEPRFLKDEGQMIWRKGEEISWGGQKRKNLGEAGQQRSDGGGFFSVRKEKGDFMAIIEAAFLDETTGKNFGAGGKNGEKK